LALSFAIFKTMGFKSYDMETIYAAMGGDFNVMIMARFIHF
jgi:hypothetical protein